MQVVTCTVSERTVADLAPTTGRNCPNDLSARTHQPTLMGTCCRCYFDTHYPLVGTSFGQP